MLLKEVPVTAPAKIPTPELFISNLLVSAV